MEEKTSTSAVGYAFCRSSRIPERAGARQVKTFGTPSTRIKQYEHAAAKQKGPRGRWYFTERENTDSPAASSETATGSPSNAGIESPSKSTAISLPRGSPFSNRRIRAAVYGRCCAYNN